MLLIIIRYFFHNYFWPRPRRRPHSPGLGLEVLASFNITAMTCGADKLKSELFCRMNQAVISKMHSDGARPY